MMYMLAVDGGGSHTRAGLYDVAGTLVAEGEGGPANPVDTSIENCVNVIASVARSLLDQQSGGSIDTIVAGIAGASEPAQDEEIGQQLIDALGATRAIVTDDLVPLLIANVRSVEGVVVVSGTGSCVLARDMHGQVARLGGRGPVMGDRGSAYQIALAGLREAAAAVDQRGPDTSLVRALVEFAELEAFSEFGEWTANASRDEVAGLATVVSREAEEDDGVARVCLEEQARELVRDVVAAFGKFDLQEGVPVVFHGGVFDNSPIFTRAFVESLTQKVPSVSIEPGSVTGHHAAAKMALTVPLPDYITVVGTPPAEPEEDDEIVEAVPVDEDEAAAPAEDPMEAARSIVERMRQKVADAAAATAPPPLPPREASPFVEPPAVRTSVVPGDLISAVPSGNGPGLVTEQRLPASRPLDRMSALEISQAMSMEDSRAAVAVASAATSIAAVIDEAASSLREGGRIIYVGAGTSGRLGVLDAAECPPTFAVSPDQVVALIAGGDKALRESVEGAEDDTSLAIFDIQSLDPPLESRDLVVGISASGSTPYVVSALDYAKTVGAKSAIVCCNPVPPDRAAMIVSLATGPEILPGSTRLKAGTATKLVLNQITTGAMALAGYVYDGYMVGVKPENSKLRDRAARILAELTDTSGDEAEKLLSEAGGRIPVAVIMARLGLGNIEAEVRLQSAGGSLRAALESE